MTAQKRGQQRCDVENVTDERLTELKSIPHFPLFSASVFATDNGGENENNDSASGGDGNIMKQYPSTALCST